MDVKRKRFLVLGGLAICSVLALVIYLHSGHDDPGSSNAPQVISADPDASAPGSQGIVTRGNSSKESDQVAPQPEVAEHGRNGIDWDEVELQAPATVEAWEDEHYMPSSDKMNEYLSMSNLELQRLAETGDVHAMQTLGGKLALDEKEVASGVEWLIDAASYGSVHAIHELANIYLQPVGESGSPDIHGFLAWKRVAYRMGDWQALLGLPHSYLKQMSSEDLLMVDVMAAAFFAQINDRHIGREGVPIEIELRPGFEQALNQILSGD